MAGPVCLTDLSDKAENEEWQCFYNYNTQALAYLKDILIFSFNRISAHPSKLDSFHISFSIFTLVSPFSAILPGIIDVEVVAKGETAGLVTPLLVVPCCSTISELVFPMPLMIGSF